MRLIYDVGMNRGEDTEFYLKRGYRVVGVEANPALITGLNVRFEREIRSGQLHIIDKAIHASKGHIRFAVNPTQTHFGTTEQSFVTRNKEYHHVESDFIEVECITFDEILRQHGMPYYLKMDIEGSEVHCLSALGRFDSRPRYLSLESRATEPGYGIRDTLDELRILRRLGYSRFQYVDQSAIPGTTLYLSSEGGPITHTFPDLSSGPFGSECPGRWRSAASSAFTGVALRLNFDVLASGRLYNVGGIWRLRRLRQRLTGKADRWYDLHAAHA